MEKIRVKSNLNEPEYLAFIDKEYHDLHKAGEEHVHVADRPFDDPFLQQLAEGAKESGEAILKQTVASIRGTLENI